MRRLGTCLAVALAGLPLALAQPALADGGCRGGPGPDTTYSDGHNRGPGGPPCPTAVPDAPARQPAPAPQAAVPARPASAPPAPSPSATAPVPSPLPTAAPRPAEAPAPRLPVSALALPAAAGLGLVLLVGGGLLARRRLAGGLSAG